MKPEQLTALALHELTEEEHNLIQAELHDSPELQTQLDSTTAFCQLLDKELGSADFTLTAEQRSQLHASVMQESNAAAPQLTVIKGKAHHPVAAQKPALRQPLIWITGIAAAGITMLSYQLTNQSEQATLLETKTKDATRREKLPSSESVRIQLGKKESELAHLATTPMSPPPAVVMTASPAKPLPAEGSAARQVAAETTFKSDNSADAFAGTAASNSPAPLDTNKPSTRAKDHTAFGARAPTGFGDVAPLFQHSTTLPALTETFLSAHDEPLSTFSADVDTAAYAMVRRSLNAGHKPMPGFVRLEELINYFPYDYADPAKDQPFSVDVQITEAPWQPKHRLARIGIKARPYTTPLGASNYVFLIDISGSMAGPDRLGLVKQSLHMLVDQLHAADRVALVTYAGSTSVVLPSTAVENKEALKNVIANLSSGGSTAGSSGIQLAYAEAKQGFIKGGVNRVLLCTDGDFNVGITEPKQLEDFITQEAKSGVYLSVLGFGTGNMQDHKMETLADKGNGNYAYIDSLSEARKVLIDQRKGTLITVAKDVKFQVEFNPFHVQSYRLLGYENRRLNKEDFNNDQKDAGEVGADHTVTALYEMIPAGSTAPDETPLVDELKYKKKSKDFKFDSARPKQDYLPSPEIMTVKIRYKAPDTTESQRMETPVTDNQQLLTTANVDTQFISAVAAFAMKLREDPSVKDFSWETIRELALKGKGADTLGYRGEFLQLIDKARSTEK